MKPLKGPLYLFCAFTLAGTSVLSAQFVSEKLGVFTITCASLFFALVFLLPFCRGILLSAVRSLTGKDLIFLFLQALFGMFLFRMFLIMGLLHTSAGEAGILTGATPAITAILACFFLKEHSDFKKLLGVFSTVSGVLLLQGLLLPGNHFSADHFAGNLLVLCAASCESIFNIISRFFVRESPSSESFVEESTSGERNPMNPMAQTTIVSMIAMILCLIPASLEHPFQLLSQIGIKEWLALLWYGVFVTALAFIFWYAGIKRCSAITAAAFSGMMPFTALILSVLLLGETAGIRQWSGGFLVIAGIILIGISRPPRVNLESSNSPKVTLKKIKDGAKL